MLESGIPTTLLRPPGNAFRRAWAFARSSAHLLARHPGLLVIGVFGTIWYGAFIVNVVPLSAAFRDYEEFRSSWHDIILDILVLQPIILVGVLALLGMQSAALTILRGGSLNILVAMSVAGRNLRPVVALVVIYFLTDALYFVVIAWASPSGNALLHGVFLIVFVSFAAITLFSLVHLAARGGGFFAAVRTSLRLVRAAGRDATIFLVIYAALALGSLVLSLWAASLPSEDESILFGEFGARLLHIGLSVPVSTLMAIYLCQLFLFARRREMERAAAANQVR